MIRGSFVLFLLAVGSLLFTRCSTDFDITSEYKEVMVVWGLLDVQDEDHYIRIQKAYLDQQTSALVLAQEPDSIYYPDILNVTLTESGTNKVMNLARVDGDTLGIQKDSGTFAASPNILYRLKANLDANRSYTLKIENTMTGLMATSTTEMVKDFTVTRPFETQMVNFVGPSDFFAFWTVPDNGRIHDLTIRLHYSVAAADKPNTILRQEFVDWPVILRTDIFDDQGRINISGQSFFQGVQSFLDPEPNTVRYFDSLDFKWVVGTPTLSDYISYNIAGTGITQDLATTQFTNIENGLGLFTSRYHKDVTGIDITLNSLDSLACGPITGDLGFAPRNDPQLYPDYPFCN